MESTIILPIKMSNNSGLNSIADKEEEAGRFARRAKFVRIKAATWANLRGIFGMPSGTA